MTFFSVELIVPLVCRIDEAHGNKISKCVGLYYCPVQIGYTVYSAKFAGCYMNTEIQEKRRLISKEIYVYCQTLTRWFRLSE